MFSKSGTRRIFIALLCAMFLFGCISGCKTRINEDKAKEVLIKVAAKHLARHVLKKNPKLIDKVEFYCKAMLKEDITQAVLDTAISTLIDLVGDDPILVSDFYDLKDLVIIDMESPDFDMSYVHAAVYGFLEGAELAKLDIG